MTVEAVRIEQPPAATTVVDRPVPLAAPEPRRRTGGRLIGERWALVGSLAGALALNGLLFQRLTPFSGVIGFAVGSWLCFLGLYSLVMRGEGRLAVRDRLVSAVVHSLAVMLFSVLVWVVVYVFLHGLDALRHLNFFTEDLSLAGPADALVKGGALHAAVGTLSQILMALAITIPLGISCAVFLGEVPGRFTRLVRTLVEAMTALPSIVAALFVLAVLVLGLHFPRSGFATSVAQSVMMLPILIRAADVVLRLVPASLKEASYALGAGRWRTVWTVTLPSARSGLATAVILAAARGIGETSPVLLCSGYTKNLNLDPTEGPQASLPLMAFTLIKIPSDFHRARAFGAATVLLVMVLALFLVARLIGGRGPGDLTAGRHRRRALKSAEDFRRMVTAKSLSQAPTPAGPAPQHLPAWKAVVSRSAVTRTLTLFAAFAVFASSLLFGAAPRAAAENFRPISGAGSTWSFNAVDAWVTNVRKFGMTINFDPVGSSAGRNQFKNGTTDFGISEIPYGLPDNGQSDPAPGWPYAYLPIVAGGTSFMYNLKIGANRVTNLRLSGETIAKIFTGKITKWNDPAVLAENPSLNLPPLDVHPIVRSDGSGTTAQLTTWLSKKYPAIWDDYCKRSQRQAACGMTSFFPLVGGSGWQALSSSISVAGAVAADANVGAITYVEYSYAKNANFPVVKVANANGYYIEPNGPNVATALKAVQINSDLTQKLDGVYDSKEDNAYPLSSYSYMLVHTSPEKPFDEAKGKTLAAFGYYFLCEGQKQADDLGYAPLTAQLVESGFQQLAKIPGSEKKAFDRSSCSNPTFGPNGSNPFADSAPKPRDCDKVGSTTQCETGTGGAKQSTPVSAGKGGAGSKSTAAAGAGSSTGAGSGGTGGAGAAGAGGSAAAADPALGDGGSGGGGGGGQQYTGDAVALAAGGGTDLRNALMLIAGALLAALIVLPPVVMGRSARASTGGPGQGGGAGVPAPGPFGAPGAGPVGWGGAPGPHQAGAPTGYPPAPYRAGAYPVPGPYAAGPYPVPVPAGPGTAGAPRVPGVPGQGGPVATGGTVEGGPDASAGAANGAEPGAGAAAGENAGRDRGVAGPDGTSKDTVEGDR